MAYTKKNIKNLTGGVSQQPDSERFDNQCTEQINFLSDPVKGLTKRAGTTYGQYIDTQIALNAASKNTFTHIINRSATEQLMLVVGYVGAETPKLELFRLNTENDSLEELAVTGLTAGTHAYLSGSSTTQPLSAVTIADYTFIANKAVTPAMQNLAPTYRSGNSALYEREHTKRGLIFIKEGAYSSNWTIKATDSEGTVRTIHVETSHGIGTEQYRADIRTDQIAGAIHWCLNQWNENEDVYDSQAFGMAFGVGHYSGAMAAYTEEDCRIRMRWSDDSTLYTWNRGWTTTTRGGSNYDAGNLLFSTVDAPDNNDTVTIKGCNASNTTRTFEFTTDGNVGSTGGIAHINVDIDANKVQTIWNLVDAINSTNASVGMGVHATQFQDWEVVIHSTIDGTGVATARDGNLSKSVGLIEVTITQFAGAVDDPAHATAFSTAPVRHKIRFDRQRTSLVPGTIKSSGSVISWLAQFASKAEADASPINIEVTDSYGNSMTELFTKTTDSIAGLPTVAPNNYSLKIEGDKDNDADDHYIKFETEDNNQNFWGAGEWKESLQDGQQHRIDASTMPHQLVRVNSTTYKFQAATWAEKTVGDDNSDPQPSFIGKPINDLFFYKSRLGILAGESVIMSEVDNAYNFWRTSVMTSVDSDRIDLTSSVNEITQLNWAIPFANQLVIFSDRSQFLLTQGSQGLTPSTAALSLGSSYENSTTARPAVSNNTIVFAQENSGASAIYEMYPTGSTDLSFEAVSISEHIPSYIDGKVVGIYASSLSSAVVVETDSNDNTLYVYNYYNQGATRVQSAWSKYELSCNYLKVGGFVSDKLHLIEGHNTVGATAVTACSWMLTHMKFDNTDSLTNAVDVAWDVPTAKMTADTPSSGITRIEMEWNMAGNTDREANIVVFDKTTNVLYPVDVTTSIDDQYVYVTGAISSNTNIVIGLKFTATYEFSKQYIKRGSADGKEVPITDGRTTNKWMEIYFNDTQHLTATVAFPSYAKRTTSTKTFNGNPDNTITGVRTGEQPSETQSLRTSVAARNDLPIITLSSDTHQTVTVTGASFELMHTSRTSRTS